MYWHVRGELSVLQRELSSGILNIDPSGQMKARSWYPLRSGMLRYLPQSNQSRSMYLDCNHGRILIRMFRQSHPVPREALWILQAHHGTLTKEQQLTRKLVSECIERIFQYQYFSLSNWFDCLYLRLNRVRFLFRIIPGHSFVNIRIVYLHTLRAYRMCDMSICMCGNVIVNLLPVVLVIPDFLAEWTDWQDTLQGLYMIERVLEVFRMTQ